MPPIIPLSIMAAGTVAGAVGRNKAAKDQNKLLQGQMDLTRGYGDWAKGRSEESRDWNRGLFNRVSGGVNDLWNQLGGASAGPGSFHDPYMSESQPFYRNAMSTGLFTPEQMNDYRARAAIGNKAIFQGYKRNLDEAAGIRGGGYAGYSGQLARLGRDTARQGEEARLGAETSLQDMIRRNQFTGAEGITRNDTTYQGLLQALDQMKNQYGIENARLGLAGMEGRGNLLNLLSGFRENDLGYAGLAGNEYGQGLNAINSRQPVEPWWSTLGSGLAGGVGAYYGSKGFGPERATASVIPLRTNTANQYLYGPGRGYAVTPAGR